MPTTTYASRCGVVPLPWRSAKDERAQVNDREADEPCGAMVEVGVISHVIVAIPAKDEAELLGACLRSIHRAVQHARGLRAVASTTVVALDGCTDATPLVATEAGVATVVTDDAGVGLARDAAVGFGLGVLGHPPLALTWVACTDADTEVPAQWLAEQLRVADEGVDLVLGTVQPATTDSQRLDAWRRRHHLGEGHDHIHGANLGIRASTWTAAGGFGPLRAHEDVDLVARVRRNRCRWLATDTTRVTTSARIEGRVADGFAGYVRSLGESLP